MRSYLVLICFLASVSVAEFNAEILRQHFFLRGLTFQVKNFKVSNTETISPMALSQVKVTCNRACNSEADLLALEDFLNLPEHFRKLESKMCILAGNNLQALLNEAWEHLFGITRLKRYQKKRFSQFLIAKVIISYTQTEDFRSIDCHQCTPQTEGVNCGDAGIINDTLVTCTNWGLADVLVSCFSAFLNYDNATTPDIGFEKADRRVETGVYRACAHRHNLVPDFCANYQEQLSSVNITVVSCRTCDEEGCNTHRFTADGQIRDHATGLTVSAYLLLFGLLCHQFIMNF